LNPIHRTERTGCHPKHQQASPERGNFKAHAMVCPKLKLLFGQNAGVRKTPCAQKYPAYEQGIFAMAR
jgi:hypothetical protein